jgi:hypothetical protein
MGAYLCWRVDEKTSKWPKLRIPPAVDARLGEVLARAKNGMAKMKFAEAILTQVLDLMEDTGDHLSFPEIVVTIRSQIGLRSLAEAESASGGMMAEFERRLAELEASVRIPQFPTARVAESPPKAGPTKTRKSES